MLCYDIWATLCEVIDLLIETSVCLFVNSERFMFFLLCKNWRTRAVLDGLVSLSKSWYLLGAVQTKKISTVQSWVRRWWQGSLNSRRSRRCQRRRPRLEYQKTRTPRGGWRCWLVVLVFLAVEVIACFFMPFCNVHSLCLYCESNTVTNIGCRYSCGSL